MPGLKYLKLHPGKSTAGTKKKTSTALEVKQRIEPEASSSMKFGVQKMLRLFYRVYKKSWPINIRLIKPLFFSYLMGIHGGSGNMEARLTGHNKNSPGANLVS